VLLVEYTLLQQYYDIFRFSKLTIEQGKPNVSYSKHFYHTSDTIRASIEYRLKFYDEEEHCNTVLWKNFITAYDPFGIDKTFTSKSG